MDDPASTIPAHAGLLTEADIIIADPAWHRLVRRAAQVAARAARASIAARAARAVDRPATIVLADDRTVRRLNARDRGRNKPTNVLTYDPPGAGLAGQVIIASGVVRREATAARRPPAHHLAHLIVHGALHLAGLDHHRAGDARRMEMAEARILRRIGVPNPWKPRG